MRRWASAARSSGKVESITGRTWPASSSGHTASRRARARRPFSSTERGRSVEPVMRQVALQHRQEVHFGLRAAQERDQHQPAFRREGLEVAGDVRAAHHVEHDVHPAAVGGLAHRGHEVLAADSSRRARRRAPRRRRTSRSEPAVARTRAPKARASWIAVVPIPLVPPWTSSVSPSRSPPRSNTLAHTVKNVSGTAAAWTTSRPSGSAGTGPPAPRSTRRSLRRRAGRRRALRRPRP